MSTAPTIHASYTIGDMLVDYLIDDDQRVGLRLIPLSKRADCCAPRAQTPPPTNSTRIRPIDPLAQIHCAGHLLPVGFAAGRTLRLSEATLSLRLQHHEAATSDDGEQIITTVIGDEQAGLRLSHELCWRPGWRWCRITTSVQNIGSASTRLEFLSGAVLSDLTPFAADDAPGRLFAHRFRSTWSGEGRLLSESLEDLHLERSWAGHSIQCERFGQVGSMPVRGWVPWLGVEDRAAGVCWAMQPDAPASWQADVLRKADAVSIAAGPADHEFGHFWRDLAPNDSWTAPAVTATVVVGGVADCCDRLVAAIEDGVQRPAVEADAPVAFNEWCTSWGTPTEANIRDLASAIHGRGIRYLTIDAGWFLPPQGAWHDAQGDWLANKQQFPNGIAAAAKAIRAQGLLPGIWFEWEVAGKNSSLWDRTDWLLCKHGTPITVGLRRFLDLRNPEVRVHLQQKMIHFIRDNNFAYLKMDYNETVGVGSDGQHGPGMEVIDNALAAQQFVRELKQQLPDLVIECCSSGGHRLEPSWLRLTAQASFSDIHEERAIPIVAANCQQFIPFLHNQVWAVLRKTDSLERIHWSLCAGFLGRLCVSGDVADLVPEGLAAINGACAFNATAVRAVLDGISRRQGDAWHGSWSQPQGWQAVLRSNATAVLVVIHRFAAGPQHLAVSLPSGSWSLANTFPAQQPVQLGEGQLQCDFTGSGDEALAVLLTAN